MTLKEVKEDLREIRYYYEHKKMFDRAMATAMKTEVLKKVDRYNAYMRTATARLFGLYVSLYVENNTQLVIATDWGVSEGYIRNLNRQLCEYLLEKNTEKEESLRNGKDS